MYKRWRPKKLEIDQGKLAITCATAAVSFLA
jgi:hypothetical protein